MRFLLCPTLLVLIASSVLAQPQEGGAPRANPAEQHLPVRRPRVPRPTEPASQIEMDLKEFMSLLNGLRKDALGNNWDVGQYISGARVGFFGASEWNNYFVDSRGPNEFRFEKVKIDQLQGTMAQVTVTYQLISNIQIFDAQKKPLPPDPPESRSETLKLVQESWPWQVGEEKWRIIPPEWNGINPYAFDLQTIAYFAAQRPGTLSQLRAVVSTRNLKQLSLGVMQLVQDYDQNFLFENEFWPEAVYPYIKNNSINVIPGTKEIYTFNDELSEKVLPKIGSLNDTVLFYEGRDEKPVFRYDGKAAIAFADGHVKLVTPEEAKTLIWDPPMAPKNEQPVVLPPVEG